MDIYLWISMRPLFGLAGRARIDARGSSMGSGLSSRVGLALKSALAIGVGREGSDRCSGVASSSRSGLAHKSALATGFGWTGSDRS